MFLSPLFSGWQYVYFLLGLLLISLISFIDDITPQSSKIRMLFHLISVALLIYQLHIYTLPFYWIVLTLFFVVGAINAINFMDGINGITGCFGLVTLASLYYINRYEVNFTNEVYIILPIIALSVFSIFNFRTKARCFAGDVGSIALAFIVLFLTLQLVLKTSNFSYILLLLVYGLDTSTTIFFRIFRQEPLLAPHRSHFYQFWANERRIPHLYVSSLYALSQLTINIIVINFYGRLTNPTWVIFLSLILFIVLRFTTEGPARLLNLKSTKAFKFNSLKANKSI